MSTMPYHKFNPREFILRDWLALDRTVLANERTFLAYTRTSLTLVLAGLTGIKRYLQMLGHYRAMIIAENKALDDDKGSAVTP